MLAAVHIRNTFSHSPVTQVGETLSLRHITYAYFLHDTEQQKHFQKVFDANFFFIPYALVDLPFNLL